MTTAELYEEQHKSREQADFLVQVGTTLAGSLDYKETLTLLAHLAVPKIADWCAIDMVDDDGNLQRLALAQIDKDRMRLAAEVQQRYYDPSSPYTAESVVKSGRSSFFRTSPTRCSPPPRGATPSGCSSSARWVSCPTCAFRSPPTHASSGRSPWCPPSRGGTSRTGTCSLSSRSRHAQASQSRMRGRTSKRETRTGSRTTFSRRCRTSCGRR